MTINYTALLKLCCALLISSNVSAQNLNTLDWKKTRQPKDPKDISTFVSKVEGQRVKAFKGIVHMPYQVEQIIAALQDHERFTDWVYQSKSVKGGIQADSNAFVLAFKGIWPAQDRDVAINYVYSQDPDSGGTRIHVFDLKGVYPPQDQHVRIPEFQNRWHIIPLQSGWSEVRFSALVDIGGRIPKWLANIIANDAPRRTLTALRKMLDSGHYGSAITRQ